MQWFKRQRLDFIAESLRVFGYIDRHHLARKFDISTALAGFDLKDFDKLHPGTMVYDPTTEHYISLGSEAHADQLVQQ